MAKNQVIMMKQQMYSDSLQLWAVYGRELREIKDSKDAAQLTERQEEAITFLFQYSLIGYDMEDRSFLIFSGEEWLLFKKKFAFWLQIPLVKVFWQKHRSEFLKRHQEFIDNL